MTGLYGALNLLLLGHSARENYGFTLTGYMLHERQVHELH